MIITPKNWGVYLILLFIAFILFAVFILFGDPCGNFGYLGVALAIIIMLYSMARVFGTKYFLWYLFGVLLLVVSIGWIEWSCKSMGERLREQLRQQLDQQYRQQYDNYGY